MSRIDRAVRRVSQHLASEEVLLASALGVECDGRRRQVVLVTDQRVLVVGLRDPEPLEVQRRGCSTSFEVTGGLLSISHGDTEIIVRSIDAGDARTLIGIVDRCPPDASGASRHVPRHVRVLQD